MLSILFFALWLTVSLSQENASPYPRYVGDKLCKICHLRTYRSWKQTRHFYAFNLLKPKQRANAECLGCHATGYGRFEGVGCEACHGAGSLYANLKVMTDVDKRKQLGLIMPGKATCLSCHNPACEHFEDFDYDQAITDGVHQVFDIQINLSPYFDMNYSL